MLSSPLRSGKGLAFFSPFFPFFFPPRLGTSTIRHPVRYLPTRRTPAPRKKSSIAYESRKKCRVWGQIITPAFHPCFFCTPVPKKFGVNGPWGVFFFSRLSPRTCEGTRFFFSHLVRPFLRKTLPLYRSHLYTYFFHIFFFSSFDNRVVVASRLKFQRLMPLRHRLVAPCTLQIK